MAKVGSFYTADLETRKQQLFNYFQDRIIQHTPLPDYLKGQVFPESFLSTHQYLVFPLFFRNCFTKLKPKALNELCASGYLYFKHLICLDALLDKDVKAGSENAVSEEIQLLRSVVYHEQSIQLLAHLFPVNSRFWTTWKQRAFEFTSSLLIDKVYDLNMDYKVYAKLSTGKCAYLKASADSFFHQGSSAKRKLYQQILSSLDQLSIGRCLQDDFEDFKKDLTFRKNNYGHVLLKKHLDEEGKNFTDYSPNELEKLFYATRVAEDLLELSKEHFNKAISLAEPGRELLPEYIRHIEAFRNKSNLVKVNIEAYRVSKYFEAIRTASFIQNNEIDPAIKQAQEYITALQNGDGSWYEVSNKQGLSNVWATAFIAMNLHPASPEFTKAAEFLFNTRQKGLWGYNRDWLSDFDTTTCSLMVLKQSSKNISQPLTKWLAGQDSSGGFSTYGRSNTELAGYLGIRSQTFLEGWTSPHVCVSSLAYYLLANLDTGKRLNRQKSQLRSYLIKNIGENGTWKPYWWSSFIYPTVYSLKALIKEGEAWNSNIVNAAVKYTLSRQSKDGSFRCDVLKKKSVLYTAMVLELLCLNPELFRKHRRRAELMKNWLLEKQYTNGSFEGTDFLVIPMTNASASAHQSFRLNKAGGTGTVTGEIAGLFSTAIALNALTRYKQIQRTASYD